MFELRKSGAWIVEVRQVGGVQVVLTEGESTDNAAGYRYHIYSVQGGRMLSRQGYDTLGQCRTMLARDRLIREEAEQRTNALAARPVVIESEVVAHHLVQGVRSVVLHALDDVEDLVLGIGNQQVQIGRGEHGRRIQAGRLHFG